MPDKLPVNDLVVDQETAIDETVTLHEFCLHQSSIDKSKIELLHAFQVSEKINRNLNDTIAAYQTRFIAFANQPA